MMYHYKTNGEGKTLTTRDIEFQNRILTLTGEIHMECAEALCTDFRVLASSSSDPIIFYINSPGGIISAGLALLDTMDQIQKSMGIKIHTCVTGLSCSMAALISATGDVRYIHPNAYMMIHQPLIGGGGISGQTTDVMIAVDRMVSMRKTINRILSAQTGQTQKRIAHDTERDTWMNAEQAVSYGLADKIGDPFFDTVSHKTEVTI